MSHPDRLKWAIFDADNTLWQTEILYDQARQELCRFLGGKVNVGIDEISQFQRQNDRSLFRAYGYSASRFARSFEETCRQFLSDATDEDLRHVRRLAEKVFEDKARPYRGVDSLLRGFAGAGYRLGLLTAGERWVQEKRLRDFHLTQMFRGLLVVERKDADSFKRFCEKYTVDLGSSVVIGDSVNSDVNPALEVGLNVVWVQHPNWDEAESGISTKSDRLTIVQSIHEVGSALGLSPYDPRPIVSDFLDAFGVFEGGGAKGLAHVGALKAAERRGIRFVGLAGTSAGAIVAALHAAGFTADEMFDPTFATKKPFNENWITLIGDKEWKEGLEFIREIRKRVSNLVAGKASWIVRNIPFAASATSISKWMSLGDRLHSSLPGISRSVASLGYFSTANFEKWLNALLLSKVQKPADGSIVTFSDLDFDLRIISSDISSSRMIVHSAATTPKQSIAKAVCASIAIPGFFQPVEVTDDEGDTLHLDGGIVSNFPAWLFIDAGEQHRTPIIGFELTDCNPSNERVKLLSSLTKQWDAIDFLAATVSTLVSGKRQLEIRGLPNLYSVQIPVTASTFDFDVNDAVKKTTFDEGNTAARRFFKNAQQLVSRDQMAPALYFAYQRLLEALGGDVHLRVNIMDRTGTGDVAVRYSYNMDFDADEFLVFPEGAGGVGRCIRARTPIIVDLEDAKLSFSDYSMKRIHQALVRPTLRALLCVPMFDPSEVQKPISERRIIGILNFDSDDPILGGFGKVDHVAVDIASVVAVWWYNLASKNTDA